MQTRSFDSDYRLSQPTISMSANRIVTNKKDGLKPSRIALHPNQSRSSSTFKYAAILATEMDHPFVQS